MILAEGFQRLSPGLGQSAAAFGEVAAESLLDAGRNQELGISRPAVGILGELYLLLAKGSL